MLDFRQTLGGTASRELGHAQTKISFCSPGVTNFREATQGSPAHAPSSCWVGVLAEVRQRPGRSSGLQWGRFDTQQQGVRLLPRGRGAAGV